ncbi:MAG TPA: dienelactone hydrolase family protein [Vicinamibacterales bacterium]|jgi:dienelactone hydrolase|nr:dienelactone hydrolase family protein [Vicinamibacterales bacterium]
MRPSVGFRSAVRAFRRSAAAASLVCFAALIFSGSPARSQDDPFTRPSDLDSAPQQIVETNVTTPSGGTGVMVRPSGSGPFPAVLHLHGSGESVAKSLVVLRLFARAGYVAMDIDYKETGNGIDVDDVYRSLEFLKASRYVRKNAIGLNGFSLGARTALRIALTTDVKAVSAIAARTTSGAPPTILDQADRLTMPILLQHGTEDPQVPYADSVALEQKLKGLKRRVQLVSYKGAEHNNLPWDRVYQRVLQFFRDNVR